MSSPPSITTARSISSAAGSGGGGACFLNGRAAMALATPPTMEMPTTRPRSRARKRNIVTSGLVGAGVDPTPRPRSRPATLRGMERLEQEAERLEGAIWGHLVGDALGVPYEFRDPGSIGEVVFGATGTHGQPPGTWSDDGALMLALLDSLVAWDGEGGRAVRPLRSRRPGSPDPRLVRRGRLHARRRRPLRRRRGDAHRHRRPPRRRPGRGGRERGGRRPRQRLADAHPAGRPRRARAGRRDARPLGRRRLGGDPRRAPGEGGLRALRAAGEGAPRSARRSGGGDGRRIPGAPRPHGRHGPRGGRRGPPRLGPPDGRRARRRLALVRLGGARGRHLVR